MFVLFNTHGDLDVILASLCGALAYIITQRNFDILRQSVAFLFLFPWELLLKMLLWKS